MENGSTLQPSGIKVQSVFLPLLPQSTGCSVLFFSTDCGTDRSHTSLLGAPAPSLSSEHVQPESLRPSCVTLVTGSLLVAMVVAPVPCLAQG